MKSPSYRVIAIDGPAASGKSSVARGLAARLGCAWVNSGAFYRAVTWLVLNRCERPFTDAGAAGVLRETRTQSSIRDGVSHLILDGEDPSSHLRSEEVNAHVSPVSQLPAVREFVSEELRQLASLGECVVEGRDIGTCVFPGTPFKFYIDATPEERLRRRKAQGQVDQIAERDRQDSQRALAPLVAAEDAVKIDSTHLGIEEVIEKILGRLDSLDL